jgi:hypothetical protein
MWAVRSQVTVGRSDYLFEGTPTCGDPNAINLDSRIAAILEAAAKVATDGELPWFAGPIFNIVGGAIDREVRKTGGSISKILSPASTRYATCAPLMIMIPRDAKLVSYRLRSWANEEGTGTCPGDGGECGRGHAKFLQEPKAKGNGATQIVSTTFENWAHDKSRTAIMIVFFTSDRAPTTKRM